MHVVCVDVVDQSYMERLISLTYHQDEFIKGWTLFESLVCLRLKLCSFKVTLT